MKPLSAKQDRQTFIARLWKAGLWTAVQPDALLYDPERDGVTFSVLDGFNACRELARLNLHGVTSRGSSVALVFGTIIHGVLQHVYGQVQNGTLTAPPTSAQLGVVLDRIQKEWETDNPRASVETRQHLEFSMLLAAAVAPRYFNYWKTDFSRQHLTWDGLEQEFKLPITVTLPSGRVVQSFVRGKKDGTFTDRQHQRHWLFETKSKSTINEETLSMVLPHELQVNIYMWAMRQLLGHDPGGVRYNIIRRPGLRQKKNESVAEFAHRCADDVAARPDFYFIRMDMDVTRADLDKFEGEFADLLQSFMAWWYGEGPHFKSSRNCENRYGACHMLPLCGRKEFGTLYLRDRVFRELEEI
jgi:hypothetical protein